MEKLRTARLNKHKRQGRFLLISNLNGEFPQNTIGKCKFHYSTILEMRWPLFHWISHLRWILLNSRKMKSEQLLDRVTHSFCDWTWIRLKWQKCEALRFMPNGYVLVCVRVLVCVCMDLYCGFDSLQSSFWICQNYHNLFACASPRWWNQIIIIILPFSAKTFSAIFCSS